MLGEIWEIACSCAATRSYRPRYLVILRHDSVSADRKRSMGVTVTRAKSCRRLVCGGSTCPAASDNDAQLNEGLSAARVAA
jgi:hypothetical protein